MNALIYTMGDKTDDILSSFGLSDDDQKKYSVMKNKFDNYFVKWQNVIFEQTKFSLCKLLQDETVDDFIADLLCLAEHCTYGELREEMIRDRLVVGLLDATLSEEMQLDAELMLDKALTMAHQTEAIRQQQPVVRSMLEQDSPTVECEKIESVNYVSKNPHKQRPTRNHAGVGSPNRPQTI